MTKEEAIALIDNHKNKLINPVEMLDWTWLRVTINQLPDEIWEKALDDACEIISK